MMLQNSTCRMPFGQDWTDSIAPQASTPIPYSPSTASAEFEEEIIVGGTRKRPAPKMLLAVGLALAAFFFLRRS